MISAVRGRSSALAVVLVSLLLAGLTIAVDDPIAGAEPSSGLVSIAPGGYQTCGLAQDGTVRCWGANDAGQAGPTGGGTIPGDVPGLETGVASLELGFNHSCAVTTGGAAKCWGYNLEGELGDGTTGNSATPTDVVGLASGVVKLSASGQHTCAVTVEGTVECWGRNASGQLGTGSVIGPQTCGPFPCSTAPVSVGELDATAVDVAAGGGHTCALQAAGAVECWGANGGGSLGDGTNVDSPRPVDVVGLSAVAAITAGNGHTCALTTGGGVRCWGQNSEGQLGDGTRINRNVPVDVIGLGSGVSSVVAGPDDTCALLSDGRVRCWGYNSNGELGNGTSTGPESCGGNMCSTSPVEVVGLPPEVATISAGLGDACAVTLSGIGVCWGLNVNGELGADTGEQTCFSGNPCSTTPVEVLTFASTPGAPSIGTAVGENQQAAVSWTAPSSHGGSAITGYVVTPYVGDSPQPSVTYESTATTQTVTGLANGTTYVFRVQAINAVGTGSPTAASNPVTPAAPTAPGVPTIGTATAGNSQATLSWTTPTSTGGAPILGYIVTPYIGFISQGPRYVPATPTTATISGLTNGTTYRFKVRARNAAGISDFSAASNPVTPAAPTAPGVPTIGTATAGNSQATLSWTAPTSTGGAPILGYIVTPYIGFTSQGPRYVPATPTTATISGLTNGTTYRFKVRARNAAGISDFSAASNPVTPAT